ncbi:sulfonate ABC transporter substrate-binding protein, partial [Bacteroides ovatus]|nr:sulfonate ABC transporter substrate-binding protein [Bacteroides ovatus]
KVAFNKGSNVHYLLVKALEHAGLTYADIQPIYLTPADARAAFVQRSVDAWVIWDPYLAAAERQLGARVVANGDGLVRNTQYYLAARKYAA